MIKLIVSDMDGTLLTDDKVLNDEINEIILKLKSQGVKFAVASGRQFVSLKKSFEKVIDDVIIVSDNGCLVTEKQEELNYFSMDKEIYHSVLDAVTNIDGLNVEVCGKYKGYVDSQRLYNMLKNPPFYYAVELVEDFYEIEEVAKLTLMFVHDDVKNIDYYMNQIVDKIHKDCYIVSAGRECIDIGIKGVNKGRAVKAIQEKYNIDIKETMVFGDEFNDVEMLKQAYYSYAMEEACNEIKDIANFVAPSNNEDGVIRIIKERFGW